jgi:hypothetical protein
MTWTVGRMGSAELFSCGNIVISRLGERVIWYGPWLAGWQYAKSVVDAMEEAERQWAAQ